MHADWLACLLAGSKKRTRRRSGETSRYEALDRKKKRKNNARVRRFFFPFLGARPLMTDERKVKKENEGKESLLLGLVTFVLSVTFEFPCSSYANLFVSFFFSFLFFF